MGDVVHLMPALSEFNKHYPQAQVDWLVEESFAEIPHWHPCVQRVIKVATRRWRSFNWQNLREFLHFKKELRSVKYDVVIDAQGLMKSAVLSRFARLNKGAKRIGFSADSIKESPAANFYNKKIEIPRDQHAIERLRQLFAKAFNYPLENEPSVGAQPALDYQINLPNKANRPQNQQTIFFLHGTTWPSKHLPDQVWRDLLDLVTDDGYRVSLCWGNEIEHKRALWIAQDHVNAQVLDKMNLNELAQHIQSAAGVIAVDTGLAHIAAALEVPAVSVYGATDARLTGALGQGQQHLQTQYPCSPCLLKNCDKITDQVITPPCYQTLSATHIWQLLYERIA